MTRNFLISIILVSLFALGWSVFTSREGERIVRELILSKIREVETTYDCKIDVRRLGRGISSIVLSDVHVYPLKHNLFDVRIKKVRVGFSRSDFILRKSQIESVKIITPVVSAHLPQAEGPQQINTDIIPEIMASLFEGLGEIEILGGTAGLFREMKSGPLVVFFRKIVGNVVPRDKGDYKVKLLAESGSGGKVKVEGTVETAQSWNITANMTDLDLDTHGPLVKDIKGLKYKDGSFDWSLRFTPGPGPKIWGRLNIKKGRIVTGPIELENLNGIVIIEDDKRRYEGLKCSFLGNKLTVNGIGLEKRPGLSDWDLKINAGEFDLESLETVTGWKVPVPVIYSPAQLSVNYKGTLRDGVPEGSFVLGDVYMPESVDASGIISPDKSVSGMEARFWYKEFTREENADEIAEALESDMDVKTEDSKSLIKESDSAEDTEDEEVIYDENDLWGYAFKLYDVKLQAAGGDINGNITLNWQNEPAQGTLEGEIVFDAVKAGALGLVGGKAILKGSPADVQVALNDVTAGALKMNGEGIIKDKKFKAELENAAGTRAILSFIPQKGRLLHEYSAYDVNASDLPAVSKMGVAGEFDADGHIFLSRKPAEGSGTMHLRNGVAGGLKLKKATFDYLLAKGKFKLSTAELHPLNGGEISSEKDGSLILEDIDIANFIKGKWLKGKISGRGRGDLASARFSGEIELKKATFLGRKVGEVKGLVDAGKGWWKTSGIKVGEHFTLYGSFATEEIELQLNGAPAAAEYFWNFADLGGICPVTSEILTYVSISGSSVLPEVNWEFNGSKGTLADAAFESMSATGLWTPKTHDIKSIIIDGHEIAASGGGKINSDGEIDMTVNSTIREIGNITSYYGVETGIEGYGSVEVVVGGDLEEPAVIGSVRIPRVAGYGVAVTKLKGSFIYKDGRFNIHSFDSEVAGRKVQAKGMVPISGSDEIDIILSVEEMEGKDNETVADMGKGKVDMHVGGFLNKPEIEGSMSVVNGHVPVPLSEHRVEDISALINISEGVASLGLMKGRVFGGDVMLEGTLEVSDLFNPRGNIIMNATGCRIQYPEMFKDAPKDGISYNGRLDMRIETRFTSKGIEVHGQSTLRDGRFTLPAGTKMDEPLPWRSPLKMEVTVGPNVWVENDVTSLELSGTLLASAPENFLVLNGTLGINRGTIQWLENLFHVTQGNIHFQSMVEQPSQVDKKARHIVLYNGQDGVDADFNVAGNRNTVVIPPTLFSSSTETGAINIAISAEAVFNAIKVTMGILGAPDNMVVSFTSDPEIPEEQLMTLVNTGKAETDASSGNVITMIQDTLSQRIIRDFQRNVGRGLQLDEFRIDTSSFFADRRENFNVTMGKYLDERLYIKYQRELLQEAESRFGIEIRTGKNMVIESEINREDEFKVGLKYKYRF